MGKTEEKNICNLTEHMGNTATCGCCYASTETCIRSRRCFMTGEYCSKQTNIQRERIKLYKEDHITAFVIMNFSDMSDVMYKWRMRSFIESLTKYLYIHKKSNRIYCCDTEQNDLDKEQWTKVKEIQVVRSDSDPASNYVICSRICQQMQIADLIIVDVSSQNANVFYEFGMAVALGKLILPICYSESFYKMELPQNLQSQRNTDHLKKHIGCYPWRKQLFEYYGIRYREDKAKGEPEYIRFKEAAKASNGFSDAKYDRFPYREILKGNTKTIGQIIYEKLQAEYNKPFGSAAKYNTLVVYTMDGFLNEVQAGSCIVNFYHSITSRMKQEQCFCGERVGVLVQEKVIPEGEKDAQSKINLYYNVGEIIHIGLNQATYLATSEKIKTPDFLEEAAELKKAAEPEKTAESVKSDSLSEVPEKGQLDDIKRFIKEHIRNRGMLIYPNNPIYVSRMKNKIQENLLENCETQQNGACNCCNLNSFCLYHVMLRNLRYTNEIVVDISDNCLQSLFWLGAAHGSDVYAITVLHEETDEEREITTGTAEKNKRNVFDVAGLWTAIFRTNDTEGFYQQLALAQMGIEQHTKLLLRDNRFYQESIREYFLSLDAESDKKILEEIFDKRKEDEKAALESFYRKHFWDPMLRNNRLNIYLMQHNDEDIEEREPRIRTAKWDFDAVSELSHYLSKRTVIGEYFVKSLLKDNGDEEAERTNFICIGSMVAPLGKELPYYIYEIIGPSSDKYGNNVNVIHRREEAEIDKGCKNGKWLYKGFASLEKENFICTQHPQSKCSDCCFQTPEINETQILSLPGKKIDCLACRLVGNKTHIEIAQLILWRDDLDDHHDRSYFRVGINGCSGPATYGLSSLFVDEEQKKEFFAENPVDEQGDFQYLLYDLQDIVRKKFMEVFLKRLQEELEFLDIMVKGKGKSEGKICDDQKKRYFNLVKHAVSYYLSTVLYRYFLPFLSEEDMNRIYNGMYIYIHSMKAVHVSPFALGYTAKGKSQYSTTISDHSVTEVAECIPRVLLEVLKSFKGVEAFYQVTVSHCSAANDVRRDNRVVQKLETMHKDGFSNVNCFFII